MSQADPELRAATADEIADALRETLPRARAASTDAAESMMAVHAAVQLAAALDRPRFRLVRPLLKPPISER